MGVFGILACVSLNFIILSKIIQFSNWEIFALLAGFIFFISFAILFSLFCCYFNAIFFPSSYRKMLLEERKQIIESRYHYGKDDFNKNCIRAKCYRGNWLISYLYYNPCYVDIDPIDLKKC